MRVRILSEWNGSGWCGTLVDLPEREAVDRIRGGWAEPVAAAPSPVIETHTAPEVETAVASERKPRKGRA